TDDEDIDVLQEASSDEASSDEAPQKEIIDPLADLEGRPDAPSLNSDRLWDDFDEAFGRFQDYLAESEEAPAETQTGFRSRVRAIGAAMDVRDLLGALLDGDSLSEDEALGAEDSY